MGIRALVGLLSRGFVIRDAFSLFRSFDSRDERLCDSDDDSPFRIGRFYSRFYWSAKAPKSVSRSRLRRSTARRRFAGKIEYRDGSVAPRTETRARNRDGGNGESESRSRSLLLHAEIPGRCFDCNPGELVSRENISPSRFDEPIIRNSRSAAKGEFDER